jgi:vancomycin resistance protein YoaR
VLEPGQTFSLNGALGPRTTAKGYQLAPGIGANLEFEDSVGGGVSQLSTTLFNAVFFGCYEDVTHTVHALYISRYPMGREATLNYPSIDNKFRNDSHSGVLIRTSYSSTSVTVSLYGNKEGRSCRAEGPHILQTIPIETEFVDDPTLPVGTQKLQTHGEVGYVVENFRIISRPGQPDVRQRFLEHYSMAKDKVLRGTGLPPPPTTTVPGATPAAPPPAG